MTTFNTSCSDQFSKRLRDRFKEGRSRSAWIVQVLSVELDKLDGRDIEMMLEDQIFKTKLVPELRELLRDYEPDQILFMFSGTKEERNELRKKLSVEISDDELKRAMNEVLKDYD